MVEFLQKKDVFKQEDIQKTFNKNGFYIFAVTKNHKYGVLSTGAFETPEAARERMVEEYQSLCPKAKHFEIFSGSQTIKFVGKNKTPATSKRHKNILADRFVKKEDIAKEIKSDKDQLIWSSYIAAACNPDTVGFAITDKKNDSQNITFVHQNDTVVSFSQEAEYLYGDVKSNSHTCGKVKAKQLLLNAVA